MTPPCTPGPDDDEDDDDDNDDDDEDDINYDDDDYNGNDKNVDVTPRRCTHPWRRIKHHNIWLLGNWHTYLP